MLFLPAHCDVILVRNFFQCMYGVQFVLLYGASMKKRIICVAQNIFLQRSFAIVKYYLVCTLVKVLS